MKIVFVAQPVTEEFAPVYDLIRRAGTIAGVQVVRLIDASPSTLTYIGELHQAIESADLVICDVSRSNSNVMYELGYARARDRPVVAIARSLTSIPFDVSAQRVLIYDLERSGGPDEFVEKLAAEMSEAARSPDAFRTRKLAEMPRQSVFVSYSHRDEVFLRRLLVHLRPLEKQGMVDLWVDTRLAAGDDWKQEVRRALARARIAVLLVSADFLASDFIVDDELPPLLKGAESAGVRILPVILKPCRFLREPLLARFQAINSPTQPLISISEAEQEILYDKVAQAIERALGRPE